MSLNYFSHKENTDRPPLIFIHGAGGNYLSWPAHIRRIQGPTIYALELNGHGRSKGDGRSTIQEHVWDVLQFMDSLEIKQAVLIGHSMGGAIALTLALEDQARIDKLILIGTGAKLRVAPELLQAASKPETFSKAVDLIIDISFNKNADERVKELTRRHMLGTNPKTLHADLLACDSFNVVDSISRLSVPTLILCGEKDRMTPVKFSQTLHEKIPGSRLELIPNAGHFLMQEKEDELIKLLGSFLGS